MNFSKDAKPEQQLTPLAVKPPEAARLLGISERTLWSLTKEGSLPHFRIGRLVLYGVESLRRWVNSKGPGEIR